MLSSLAILKLAPSKLARSVLLSLHRTQVTLPPLPYAYDALEPYISGEIMELHHDKHHRAYVANLNVTLAELEQAKDKNDTGTIISLEPRLRFNGGGHLNHSIFWENLAPVSKGGGQRPEGSLVAAIDKTFGSFDEFQRRLTAAAAGVQGSGWAWLAMCSTSNRLAIVTTANQDPVVAAHGLHPLLGIDVWEHAYYLQYRNVRPDYLKAIWNVINWKDVQQRFEAANLS